MDYDLVILHERCDYLWKPKEEIAVFTISPCIYMAQFWDSKYKWNPRMPHQFWNHRILTSLLEWFSVLGAACTGASCHHWPVLSQCLLFPWFFSRNSWSCLREPLVLYLLQDEELLLLSADPSGEWNVSTLSQTKPVSLVLKKKLFEPSLCPGTCLKSSSLVCIWHML